MLLLWWLACAGPPAPAPAPEAAPAPETGAQVVPGEGLEADLKRTAEFHASRPIYERPLGVGTQGVVGLGSLSAEVCGACHAEIYQEWKLSTHAAAWHDRQYQAEITKSGNRWLCLNCHTPLLVQQDRWPVGLIDDDVERPLLVDNPVYDADLRDEGITCAACHVRDGVVHGPGLADSTAPHPVEADPGMRSSELCLRCHQAVATYPGKSFICTFDTGSEWQAGPYDEEGKNCVSCHMPVVERPAAAGGPVRQVRSHWWRGAGIAKVEGVQPPIEANPPGLGLAATWDDSGFRVEATNATAGHMLPTGDPERWVQIDVRFTAEDGSALEPAWQVRFGQEWTWHPTPTKHGDTRLAPRESRSFDIEAPAGAVRAVVEASSHRMTTETAEYHHLKGYPLSISTHRIELEHR